MNCAEVREGLPSHVKDGESSLVVRRHLSRCPGCRSELARYEELMDGLASLASATVDPPVGLHAALVAIPEQAARLQGARQHIARNRAAYVGGVAVALAGAGSALLWRTRRHRPAAA